MLVKNLLPDLNDGVITIRSIHNFRHAVRLRFAKKILAGFPDWGMTQGQKTVLLDSILKTTPMAKLLDEDLQENLYEDALIAVMDKDPATFPQADKIMRPVVRARLLTAFPNWCLNIEQKEAVVENILNSFELAQASAFALKSEERVAVWLRALESEAKVNTTDFRQEDVASVSKIYFRQNFERIFPSAELWPLSEFQKTAVIDRVFKMQPFHRLVGSPDPQMFVDALRLEASHGCLTCPICMEPMVSLTSDLQLDTSDMWSAKERRNELWKNLPCGHACCRSCMSTWAETTINDQKTSVKCPVDGCSYRLWDHDLAELVNDKVLSRHKENSQADYFVHMKQIRKDKQLCKWLNAHTRPCPDCHRIVSKAGGCQEMTCVCGTHFCYKCGFKGCMCDVHKADRPSIWKTNKKEHSRLKP
jgi:hypothetical protein